jgi:hypothetical protein
MQTVQYVPRGYQQVTATASSQGLTVPAGATVALITVSTAAIRWRDDGTPPTAAIGVPIAIAGTLEYWGTLSAFKFIAQSGSPVLDISYYSIAG